MGDSVVPRRAGAPFWYKEHTTVRYGVTDNCRGRREFVVAPVQGAPQGWAGHGRNGGEVSNGVTWRVYDSWIAVCGL